MKQKVMIMCAFLAEPALYIIDEPFLGLDPLAINALLERMNEAKKGGASVLMSTHILATAEAIAIRLLFYITARCGRAARCQSSESSLE